jgi:hypothetical protein
MPLAGLLDARLKFAWRDTTAQKQRTRSPSSTESCEGMRYASKGGRSPS